MNLKKNYSNNGRIVVEKSSALKGKTFLSGSKNAALPILAATLLNCGKSKLYNVPFSEDVRQMLSILEKLGAKVSLSEESSSLEIDTSYVNSWTISPEDMKKMRASILLMGPLLARFGRAKVATPGGCILGSRPIDFHLKIFKKMGVGIHGYDGFINAKAPGSLKNSKIILEYPSVGATENFLMAASLAKGVSHIVNASLEPEVMDLISALNKMGAKIEVSAPSTVSIQGSSRLSSFEHNILKDRLEAGTLILAAAITGGEVELDEIPVHTLEVFWEKLFDMGHHVEIKENGNGIFFRATDSPKPVSFRTMPFPGFPTDLQAPMTAVCCLADGCSYIQETVFDGRLAHVYELQKMGAEISIVGNCLKVQGCKKLTGKSLVASDIRSAAALVIAGLCAEGKTCIEGVGHLKRGYQDFEKKLKKLGANLKLVSGI